MNSLIQRISRVRGNSVSLSAQCLRKRWVSHLEKKVSGLRFGVSDDRWFVCGGKICKASREAGQRFICF